MRIKSALAALLVGLFVFVMAGLFITPLSAANRKKKISFTDVDYWRDNLVGAILGVAAVYVTHRKMYRYYEKQEEQKEAEASKEADAGERKE